MLLLLLELLLELLLKLLLLGVLFLHGLPNQGKGEFRCNERAEASEDERGISSMTSVMGWGTFKTAAAAGSKFMVLSFSSCLLASLGVVCVESACGTGIQGSSQ